MAEPRRSLSPGARRLLLAAAGGGAFVVLLLVAVNVVSIAWVRSLERQSAQSGAPPGRTRDAASVTPRPVRARIAASAVEAAAPAVPRGQPAGDWRAAITRLLVESQDRRGPVREHVPRLATAIRDDDAPVTDELRAWLNDHTTDLERVEEAFLREPDAESLRLAVREALPPEVGASREMLSVRAWHRLMGVLGARATEAADGGRCDDAHRACDSLLRLVALWPRRERVIPHALLRRVRPQSPEWIALLDEDRGRERIDETLDSFVVWTPPEGPYQFGLRWAELDVLLEEAPRPIHAAFEHVVLGPAIRAEWAAGMAGPIRMRRDLLGSGACLPQHLQEQIAWAWRYAVRQEADLVLTREVLRLSNPSLRLDALPSPCPDWTMHSETLSDGSLRVFVAGSVAEADAGESSLPLQRVIPAPAAAEEP